MGHSTETRGSSRPKEAKGTFEAFTAPTNIDSENVNVRVTIRDRAAAADRIGWGGDDAGGERYDEKSLVELAATMRNANQIGARKNRRPTSEIRHACSAMDVERLSLGQSPAALHTECHSRSGMTLQDSNNIVSRIDVAKETRSDIDMAIPLFLLQQAGYALSGRRQRTTRVDGSTIKGKE